MKRTAIITAALLAVFATGAWALQRNVPGQTVAGMLINKTSGAPVTSGTTTVYVVCDGTYAEGGGTTTHKGSGLWSYAPTQAETDCAHAAYVFTNADAVNAQVQTYPGEIPDVLDQEHGSGPWTK